MDNSWTIGKTLLWAGKKLENFELASPRLDAETLLSMALSRDRAFLMAHPEDIIQDETLRLYRSWITLRCSHYPIQYIRGTQEFYGRDFLVRPGILIPRPETELLVESCLDLCRNHHSTSQPLRILDIGTGSGCIAVTLSAESPGLQIMATDIDPLAISTATSNARRILPSHSSISFFVSDLGNCLAESARFDFIVSNPPYVGWKDSRSVDPSVRLHEPKTAVFSGETGLEIFQRIFAETLHMLEPGGSLLLEIGAGQEEALARMAEKSGWGLAADHQDLAGIPRCLVFSPA